MRRKRHRSRAIVRTRPRLGGIFRAVRGGAPRAAAGRRFRLHVAGLFFAVVAILLAAAAAFAGVQLLRPVPAMTMTGLAVPLRVLPGVPPRPDWPGQAEAVVGMPGVGVLATEGGSQPRPIASLAKIMAAYIVLRDHPLVAGRPGPVITVTAADVAAYARDRRQGQSVVKVAAGEKLTERQALEAMLIPSGNNIAGLLARWDAGSQAAFVAKMNAEARLLGLRGTRYADASGVDPATVSTAADQFRLTVRALGVLAFRQMVAMPQVRLPVAGLAYNVNSALGHDGIDGVKTGSTPQAGGCLVFSASRRAAGSPATIVGAVLGVRATPAQPSELEGAITASENLLRSVSKGLEHVEIVKPGTVLGLVRTAWATGPKAIAASGISVTGWPGMPVRVMVTARPLPPTIRRGQPIGWATITVGSEAARIMLDASRAVTPPSVRWRLTRL
jgi:serine-type D-Ala-D-Ala carboxypeptidase (penicillin-binding protein 5/6)